ncbi:hypothetical protein [Archangium gephyra]|uniref:hypothetical protein n=1 Tax=Archangium gephyra TaxID=48 RepID=UPI0011C0E4CE|nr:hypothetical protein [Archangium gephyra]
MKFQDLRCVAWSEAATRPGIVLYVMQPDTTLKAFWNYPSIQTGLGTGEASLQAGSGSNPIGGTYDITYSSPEGSKQSFTLRIERTQGTRYALSWKQHKEDKEPMLTGVGEWLEDRKMLVGAWDTPNKKLSVEFQVEA